MNVPIPQEKVDGWASFAEGVRVEAFRLYRELALGGNVSAVRADLMSLSDRAAGVVCDMERAGATTPSGLAPLPEVPLDLLASERNRRLLRILEDALEAAQRVDEERRQSDPGDPFAGPAASELAAIAERLRMECYGPTGRGEGAER